MQPLQNSEEPERSGAGDHGNLPQDDSGSWVLPLFRIMTTYRDQKLNWSLKIRDPKKLILSFWERLFNKRVSLLKMYHF